MSEVALATVLLIGAGLLIKSFAKLERVDPGLRSDGVLTMRVVLPSTYAQAERRRAMVTQMLEQVDDVPGVEHAGAIVSVNMPFTDSLEQHELLHRRRARAEGGRGAGGRHPHDRGRLLPRDGHADARGPHARRARDRAGADGVRRQRGIRAPLLSRRESGRPAIALRVVRQSEGRDRRRRQQRARGGPRHRARAGDLHELRARPERAVHARGRVVGRSARGGRRR